MILRKRNLPHIEEKKQSIPASHQHHLIERADHRAADIWHIFAEKGLKKWHVKVTKCYYFCSTLHAQS